MMVVLLVKMVWDRLVRALLLSLIRLIPNGVFCLSFE